MEDPFSEAIERREAHVKALEKLVGLKGYVGDVSYKITECTIHVLGESLFQFFCTYIEDSVAGAQIGRKMVVQQNFSDPDECPKPASVLKCVFTNATKRNEEVAARKKAKESEIWKA